MSHGHQPKSTEAFASAPIPQVVVQNCIPALIAMVMVMVYNLADTFFIGLTHDDLQIAAVSLGTPVFMIFMSLGTLFGVGGTSVISRALGAGKPEYARRVSAFCIWSCVAVGLLITILLWGTMESLITMLGASEDTADFTRSYLTIVVGCGVFSMLSSCFSNIIRTEGKPMKAMTGTVIGNLLNIVLDPIMILGLGWGITGAAVATVIGNLASTGYYLVYFLRGKSSLSIHIKNFSLGDGILTGVISVGLSASLSNLLVSITSILANSQLAEYGDLYVAANGVSSKVLLIVILIAIGIGSGVQPLFGYCFGARNRERLLAGIRFSTVFGLALCLTVSILCFVFAAPIVNVFLTDPEACKSGVHFARILMCTAWLIGAFAVLQNGLQGMGAALPALLASVFRQGIIFIPAMFLLRRCIGIDGILWAQPVADVLSLLIVIFMLLYRLKHTDFSTVPDAEEEIIQ